MDVGLALPTMAAGWTRSTFLDWCRIADEGPFSSVSCGERITFRNTELITTIAAAAALTTRPRVMVNLAVAPWHSPALLAKQLATIDVLSGGRLDVGVGVGGREQDYQAVGSSFRNRHQRLDDHVAELQRLWAGEPAVPGAPPLGPPIVQTDGIPLWSGALGPKAMWRAARWAVGVSGFSLSIDPAEIDPAIAGARIAWADAGRTDRPRYAAACFAVAGVPDAPDRLHTFTREYLDIFGAEFADAMAEDATLSSTDAVTDALSRAAAETDADEIILVPGDVDPACAEALADAVRAADLP